MVQCTDRNVVSVVGVLWLSWLTLRALKALAGDFCAFFLAPLGISRINLKKYGSWAGILKSPVCKSSF
jgi:17beta-estradiol 17-dehydrogenase / very-long-chain 3-oxoacyl-CoA reductase